MWEELADKGGHRDQLIIDLCENALSTVINRHRPSCISSTSVVSIHSSLWSVTQSDHIVYSQTSVNYLDERSRRRHTTVDIVMKLAGRGEWWHEVYLDEGLTLLMLRLLNVMRTVVDCDESTHTASHVLQRLDTWYHVEPSSSHHCHHQEKTSTGVLYDERDAVTVCDCVSCWTGRAACYPHQCSSSTDEYERTSTPHHSHPAAAATVTCTPSQCLCIFVVSEMTYTVSSGTLNSTISYRVCIIFTLRWVACRTPYK